MFKALNRNLRYLFILNLAFGFSVQLITPLFPLFLSNLGASAAENATVISLGGLVSTVLMLPSGLLLDRIGRRVLLIGSAVVNMVSIFLLIFTKNWQQVTPVFILYSASWALFIPARMAMITADSAPEKRGAVFGIMNTSWPIAGVISPIISGYLIESVGWNQVFIVGAAVNALSIVSGFRIQRRENRGSSSIGAGFSELFKEDYAKILLTFFIYGALMSTALGGVNLIIPLYLESKFLLSASQIALFFTVQSFITLVTQMPIGSLSDRYGKKRTILSLIFTIPFLIASWHFVGDWRIMLVLNSIGFGLWTMTWPATLSLLSESVPERLVGAAFGTNNTGTRLGQTIGPIIASFFYVNFFYTAPFLVSGMICLVAVLVAFRLEDRP
jgi:ACS family glucarate transporter-like MFS transporter